MDVGAFVTRRKCAPRARVVRVCTKTLGMDMEIQWEGQLREIDRGWCGHRRRSDGDGVRVLVGDCVEHMHPPMSTISSPGS